MVKKVSIVSPCYNEELMVEKFFAALLPTLQEIKQYQFEIIIVNDGSSDNTLSKLILSCQRDPRISIVDLSRNFGKEAALTAGIDQASGDAVIILDFDLQDPLDLIKIFLEKWEEGYESVIGVRKNRDSDLVLKRKTAEFFYLIYNKFSTVKILKNISDCRLLDRKIIEQLKKCYERQRFMKGLFSWLGAKSFYVEYVRPKRVEGISKFSGWKLWNFALEGITSFSTVPLRVWTYVGVFISFFAFAYAIFIVTRTIIFGIEVPGYSSLIVAILFLGGVQIMGIGIIGEYLGRIYMETKQRPIYLVRQVIKKSQ